MKVRNMKQRSVRAGAAATAAGMAAAASLALVPSAAASPEGGSYAYAISASGIIDIQKTPYVSSNGKPQHDNLAHAALPQDNPAVEAKVLNVKAQQGHKSWAKVVGLRLGGGQNPLTEQLPAELRQQLEGGLGAKVLKATCNGGEGDTQVVGLTLGGKEIPEGKGKVPANTTIAIPPGAEQQIAKITLNKQVTEGGGLTVTALQIKLLGNTPGKQVINVAQAHCAKAPSSGDSTNPGPGNGGKPPQAPAPDPADGNLPITG